MSFDRSLPLPHPPPAVLLAPLPEDLPFDFQRHAIGHDMAALAAHMRHCASAQGRWSWMRGPAQQMRAVAAGRIVTLACAVVALAVGCAVFV